MDRFIDFKCQPMLIPKYFLIFQVPMQEKEHKKKCLLPDDGQGLATPRGAKALGSLVRAQQLAEEVGVDESRRSFARPLPIQQQHPRQGRHFKNRRFQPQAQGQFVRGGN